MALTKEKVAIYVRKSRLKDSEALEIDRQVELLIDYADKNGYEYDIYKEEGSSEDWNRPDFQRMIRAIQTQAYDGVLVTDQDRLSRDRTDFGLFCRILKQEGILLHTLNKTYNFMNDEDMFMSGMQSEMDNHFMRMTKRKLRRGRIQAIKKGVWFGSTPFGYLKDSKTKKLMPHPEESEVIKKVFQLYVSEGYNQAEICNYLNLRGHRTREGKQFTTRATSVFLSNVAYLGIVQYQMENEEPVYREDSHPALVTKEVFDLAQKIKAEKRIVPQSSQKGQYALSKLIVCSKCGQTLSFCQKYTDRAAKEKLDKSSRELFVLNCHASKSNKKKREWGDKERCRNNGVKSRRVEEAVFEKLEQKLHLIDKEIDEILSGANDFINKVANEEQVLKERLEQLEAQKKKVHQGYIMDIFSDEEARNQIKELKEQQLEIEEQLKSLEGTDVKSEIDRKKQLKAKIEYLLSMEANEPPKTNKLLNEILECVYYWKEKSDVGSEKPFEIWLKFKKQI